MQSYKDRNPPWIRLHKKLLDNMKFQRMAAESRALLPMLWLMASEDENPVSGMIRFDYEEISFRLRIDNKIVKTSIDEIRHAGFIVNVANDEMPLFNDKSDSYKTVAKKLRNDHSESESESETEDPSNEISESDFLRMNYKIQTVLSDKAIEKAKSNAPQWDIYVLMGKFDDAIHAGKMVAPDKPNAAFPAWCKSVTKGKPPK